MTEPGFQMSFAATTALVAVFGVLRDWEGWRAPKWAQPVLAVVISSSVAGLATAPVAAAHFNRIADYGLLANLLSVPLMGAVVMPAAVLTALLTPIGLAWIGLGLMRPAIEWILGVAHFVADLDGSVTPVVAPDGAVLPIFALGMLWLILWRGRARFAGVAPVMVAFAIWSQTERPPVLISSSAGLLGVMSEQGRVLSKARGDGFSALSWLENDGDAAEQRDAFDRDGPIRTTGHFETSLGGHGIVHLSGRGASDRVEEACRTAALVVIVKDVPATAPCLLLTAREMRRTGAIAVYEREGELQLIKAHSLSGARLWSP